MPEYESAFPESEKDSRVRERLLFEDPALDRRPFELEPEEFERRKKILSGFLDVTLKESGKGVLSIHLQHVFAVSVGLFGLTQRERYNLSNDLRWKKFCLSPEQPVYQGPEPRGKH